MALNDIMKVDVHFTHQGNPNTYCFNFHVDVSAEPSAKDYEDLANGFLLSWMQPIQSWHDDSVVFHCLVVSLVKRGDPSDTSIFVPFVRDLDDVTGDRTLGIALPGQCSAVVQTFGSLEDAGPRKRGRDFITGLVETDQVDGEWTQATATLILADYEDTFFNTFGGPGSGSYDYGNYSATQETENNNPLFQGDPPAQEPPPTFGNDPFVPVGVVRMQRSVRTQRRRQHEDPCQTVLSRVAP